MEHDERHVDARELGDRRQDTVPGGERVARVEAAVAELVDDVQRAERLAVGDLPRPRQVEEHVSGAERVRNPPDDAAVGERREDEHDEREPLPGLVSIDARQRGRDERRERHEPHDEERQHDRSAHEEGDRERAHRDGQAEHERAGQRQRGNRLPGDRTHEERSGQDEHADRRREQPDVEPGAVLGQESREEQEERRGEGERDDAARCAPQPAQRTSPRTSRAVWAIDGTGSVSENTPSR